VSGTCRAEWHQLSGLAKPTPGCTLFRGGLRHARFGTFRQRRGHAGTSEGAFGTGKREHRRGGHRIATEIEALLAQSDTILPETAIVAHFDIARMRSQDNEPDRAFPNSIKGHLLLGKFQPLRGWITAVLSAA
jgi:hypothetical protein